MQNDPIELFRRNRPQRSKDLLMLSIASQYKIFVCRNPIDLRSGFEGLSSFVEKELKQSVTSQAYFVFLNKKRDRMKLLYWDGDGLVIWYKRLERGSFIQKSGIINRRSFLMMLEGITPKRLHKRYEK